MGSKSKRRPGKSQTVKPKAPAKRRSVFRHWRAALAIVLLIGISGAGLAAYQRNHGVAHDLSVIGNAIPTVVQVHDPSCSMCQALKRNVNKARVAFEDRVQFRIAHMGTATGRMFAQAHAVRHVTLVMFNGDGKRVGILTGVSEVPQLKRAFAQLAQAG